MKKILLLLLITAVAIASCTAPASKNDKTDTVVAGDTLAKSKNTSTNNIPATSSLCYLHTDGLKNQDSTSIELVVKGNHVTGQMNWLPYQKDSRKGILNGTIKDSIITATWTFMQEGMTDTLNLNFRLTNNTLLQKPLKLNTSTDRQQTDASASYSVVYKNADKFHK